MFITGRTDLGAANPGYSAYLAWNCCHARWATPLTTNGFSGARPRSLEDYIHSAIVYCGRAADFMLDSTAGVVVVVAGLALRTTSSGDERDMVSLEGYRTLDLFLGRWQ